MDWIHWISKDHYTMNGFRKEAEVTGVSRRVNPYAAQNMNWGDTIYIAMNCRYADSLCSSLDGETGVIFGSFTINHIGGLSGEASKAIRERFCFEAIDDKTSAVVHGCGSYNTVVLCAINATLPEMMSILLKLRDEGRDIGVPMLCGHFRELDKIRLMNLSCQQGFRKINAKALFHEAVHYHRKVYGQFYITSELLEENKLNITRDAGGFTLNSA